MWKETFESWRYGVDNEFMYPLPFDIFHYAAKTIKEQCAVLDIPVLELNLHYTGKPEQAVLRYFESLGYEGAHCEGDYIFLIIHALLLDCLATDNKGNIEKRHLAATRQLKIQLEEMGEGLLEVIFDDYLPNAVQVKNNLEEILSERKSANDYPDAVVELAQRIMGHLDKETLKNLTLMLCADPEKMFRGWPDLIVANDHELKLVEVKGSDNLTVNQMYTMYHLKEWFADISVVKVSKN